MSRWVMQLLLVNVVMFVITTTSPGAQFFLELVPALVLVRPWTLVTYMFLHAGPSHLFFNMIGLYFFGPTLENRLGGRHFLGLYFVSGIAGGLLSFILAPFSPVVGASGAIMGVIAAYARYWPEDRIYVMFVLPVSARWFVIAMALFSVYSGLTGSRGGVADFAHLGGLVAGYVYAMALQRRSLRVRAPRVPRQSAGEARARAARWASIRPETLHEINRAEVERLLAKVEAEGARALTPAEAEFLDRFSS